ncbi:hypothetical protein J6590_072461 [Homalodisca vitripennis]|nr:hypothetical protein J6590_072461 [Homalodisca vitripennis]
MTCHRCSIVHGDDKPLAVHFRENNRAGRIKVRKSDDKSSRVCVLNDEDDLSALIKRESRISGRELFFARYVVYRSDREAETSGKCRGGGVLLAVNKRLHARRLSGQRRQLIADTLCVKVTAPPPHSHHALYINVVYFPLNNVIEAINEMKSKRSSGPDNIPSYVVKG